MMILVNHIEIQVLSVFNTSILFGYKLPVISGNGSKHKHNSCHIGAIIDR